MSKFKYPIQPDEALIAQHLLEQFVQNAEESDKVRSVFFVIEYEDATMRRIACSTRVDLGRALTVLKEELDRALNGG